MGLDQHPARPRRPPGPARDLVEQLELALGGAQIAAREPEVAVDHADQREVREMMALGDDLGADQQVQLMVAHGA